MPVTVSRQLLGTGRVVGEEGRGCSCGRWGLSEDVPVDHGACQASTNSLVPRWWCQTCLPRRLQPHALVSRHTIRSVFPSKLPPTVLYSSARVASPAPSILSCTHKHTSTQSLQNTHSQARLPQLSTHICAHTGPHSHTCSTHTSFLHKHGHTHSPIQTCPILSHACLYILIHVPTRV